MISPEYLVELGEGNQKSLGFSVDGSDEQGRVSGVGLRRY